MSEYSLGLRRLSLALSIRVHAMSEADKGQTSASPAEKDVQLLEDVLTATLHELPGHLSTADAEKSLSTVDDIAREFVLALQVHSTSQKVGKARLLLIKERSSVTHDRIVLMKQLDRLKALYTELCSQMQMDGQTSDTSQRFAHLMERGESVDQEAPRREFAHVTFSSEQAESQLREWLGGINLLEGKERFERQVETWKELQVDPNVAESLIPSYCTPGQALGDLARSNLPPAALATHIRLLAESFGPEVLNQFNSTPAVVTSTPWSNWLDLLTCRSRD